LLPFVVLARFQHPFLVYNAARGSLAPEDLHGKRVGVRSYSVTTGAWIRHILAEDHHIDIARIHWVTYEEAHVAEFRDPPTCSARPPARRSWPCCRRASSTRRSSGRSRRRRTSSL
jgi:4,5-dihydroxyphthalate decarboxylase